MSRTVTTLFPILTLSSPARRFGLTAVRLRGIGGAAGQEAYHTGVVTRPNVGVIRIRTYRSGGQIFFL